MRSIYLGIISIISLVIFIALCFVFVFGENSLDVIKGKNLDIEATASDNDDSLIIDSNINNEKKLTIDSDSSSNEGGGGGGLSKEDSGFICNKLQPVQYSLKNFVEDISCLENIDNKCVSVAINCSVEVYNLDHVVSGIFGIKYSVVSGEDIFEEKIDEKNIMIGDMEILNAEFLLNGSFDIEDLKCSIDMNSIPNKCI